MILHNLVIAHNIRGAPLSVALTFNHQPSKVFKYFHKYPGFKWLPLISSMNFHFSIPKIFWYEPRRESNSVSTLSLIDQKFIQRPTTAQFSWRDRCDPRASHNRNHQDTVWIKLIVSVCFWIQSYFLILSLNSAQTSYKSCTLAPNNKWTLDKSLAYLFKRPLTRHSINKTVRKNLISSSLIGFSVGLSQNWFE